MSDRCPKRDTMSVEKATVSNLWTIASIIAIVKVLKQKGRCTQQDLFTIIDVLRRASIPKITFPEPHLLTETENKIIDSIFDLFNRGDLTSQQPTNRLERLRKIIEFGHRLAKGTTH